MWLDYEELDQLEDREFKMDLDKGSLVFSAHEGDYRCPNCGCTLKRFKYRLHDLELDLCPELHGFWLDRGEEKRVLELMKERGKDIKSKVKAEREWEKTLRQLRSRTFLQKVRDFFK
jgi:Zn-finger nucleic acid-binding protein